MGYKEITLKLPTDYTESELEKRIGKELGIRSFSFRVDHKSLDARKKSDIHWLIRTAVLSDEISGELPVRPPELEIPYRKRKERIVVAGSGPAGFFAAFVLQKAGFDVTILERGMDVDQRAVAIRRFEKSGNFHPAGNYAFGEGGAGTFSDGKLTSRTKNISAAKQFILSSYIHAGGPAEIAYMAHPHLGSDNLRKIVRNLRKEFRENGGALLFETCLKDIRIQNGRVTAVVTDAGEMDADVLVVASGHSAFETYRMLIRHGVGFRTKNFAIGSRAEHPQEIINLAQWGHERLPGVKAAEYRLTSKGDGQLPVYTFCMCPGGTVVPATAYSHTNIVNGMSLYQRAGEFANAACVAGVHPDKLLGKTATPLESLEWLENLEMRFHDHVQGFAAPFCGIRNFIDRKMPSKAAVSSYPLGLEPAPLWELLPANVSAALREGLKDFSRKVRGFDTGILMGLESKTSSPVQVIREKSGLCAGFSNLYMSGEGSGYAGGIISSGADGIRAAMDIIARSGG